MPERGTRLYVVHEYFSVDEDTPRKTIKNDPYLRRFRANRSPKMLKF